MTSWAYYNEIDEQKAAWLRELIKADVVAPGEVDERSISDVQPDDLRGFKQCHFFAGIGVWSYALRLAGWPDDREWWTASCPCPSFSCAGKGEGFDDPRHLWPELFRLYRESKPPGIFGEQSGDAIGHGWWDLVSTDLESEKNAVAAAVLCSAGVGATDIRHRLYFVGERLQVPEGLRLSESRKGTDEQSLSSSHGESLSVPRLPDSRRTVGGTVRMADTEQTGRETFDGEYLGTYRAGSADSISAPSESRRLAHSANDGCGEERQDAGRLTLGDRAEGRSTGFVSGAPTQFARALNGFWRDADWIFCTDGKWRPVEPGTFPLVNGASGRLLKLRGYGDCINAEVAKAFIESYQEARGLA